MKLYSLKSWKNNLNKIPRESKYKDDIRTLLFFYFINYRRAQKLRIYEKTFNVTGLQKEWRVDVFGTTFEFWNDNVDVIMKWRNGKFIIKEEKRVFSLKK